MRFRVEQRFTASSESVARAFTEPDLYHRFGSLPKVHAAEVLDRCADGDRVLLRVRYRFGGELSGPARAAVDPDKLTWVDESVHDLAASSVCFELHPDHYADRFRCTGSYQLQPTADGCRRVGEIDCSVAVPILGRAVERAIVSGLREHLDDEVAIVESHLSNHG